MGTIMVRQMKFTATVVNLQYITQKGTKTGNKGCGARGTKRKKEERRERERTKKKKLSGSLDNYTARRCAMTPSPW